MEVGGIPERLCGLPRIDSDVQILRFDNLLRDCVEPRIPGVEIQAIERNEGDAAVVIRIRRSWMRPHVVKHPKYSWFYSHNSAGKYLLDVGELKELFLASDATADRVRLFRGERVSRVIAGDTPARLRDGATTILHLIPLSAFEMGAYLEPTAMKEEVVRLAPIGSDRVDRWRYNLDGLLVVNRDSYVQAFRSGILEAVDAWMLRSDDGEPIGIPCGIERGDYERELIEALGRYLEVYECLRIDVPIVVMVTLVGAKGGCVWPKDASPLYWQDRVRTIDRDVLMLPERLVDSLDSDPYQMLKPVSDAIWNASGRPGCPYYVNGVWTSR